MGPRRSRRQEGQSGLDLTLKSLMLFVEEIVIYCDNHIET